MIRELKWMLLAMLLVSVFACDDETEENEGEGTLTVTLWGEDFIEEGIPAEELADSYAVTYTKFLIALSNISAAKGDAAPALTASDMKIWDVSKSGPFTVTSDTVPAGGYTHTAYRISPATDAATPGNADDDDVQFMIDNALSVYVEGTADDGTTAVTFTWGFETDTTYDPCHSTGTLTDGGTAQIQITIHGDHLLYDSAISENPELRFNDIALADADADGQVTETELEAYDITALSNYVVGSLDIDNMYDYIAHMTSTLGHIDGEGHCE